MGADVKPVLKITLSSSICTNIPLIIARFIIRLLGSLEVEFEVRQEKIENGFRAWFYNKNSGRLIAAAEYSEAGCIENGSIELYDSEYERAFLDAVGIKK